MKGNCNGNQKRKPKTNKRCGRYSADKKSTKSSPSMDEVKGDQTSGFNDPSWYTHNPALSIASASIPFPYRPGMQLPYCKLQVGYTVDEVTGLRIGRIPGVMTLDWMPTVGQSHVPTDPASIVGKEIYGRVRQVYSGSLDADAPDFVVYFMCLDSIFSYIAWLKRVYRVISIYTPQNYVVPDGLMYAMQFVTAGIEDLKRDKMKLYQVINELCLMSQKFKCPAVFDVFNRHYWMNDHVFNDTASPNSQLYMFNQTHYYKFKLQSTPDEAQAGGCEVVDLHPNWTTDVVNNLYNFGRDLIDALAASDDGYLISGYLSRAFENDPSFTVEPPTMGDILTPVFDTQVLSQIENSTALFSYLYSPNSVSGNEISQDPKSNSVICAPNTGKQDVQSQVGKYVDIKPMLSIRQDQPSVVDVIEATRLQVRVDSDGNINCGTEIPLAWHSLNFVLDSDEVKWSNGQVRQWCVAVGQVASLQPGQVSARNVLADESQFTEFDYAPKRIYVVLTAPSDTEIFNVHIMGDVHNITTFDVDQLTNMHRMCLYSEFNSFGIQ